MLVSGSQPLLSALHKYSLIVHPPRPHVPLNSIQLRQLCVNVHVCSCVDVSMCTSVHLGTPNTDVQSLSMTSTVLVPGLVIVTEEEFSEERETVNVLTKSSSKMVLSRMVILAHCVDTGRGMVLLARYWLMLEGLTLLGYTSWNKSPIYFTLPGGQRSEVKHTH